MDLSKRMEREVDQEKFRVCHERSMARWRTK
jgi:hypothetical protein